MYTKHVANTEVISHIKKYYESLYHTEIRKNFFYKIYLSCVITRFFTLFEKSM